MWIFQPPKLNRKKYVKTMDFLTAKITSEKLCGNDVDFLTIEIATKKARGKRGYLTSETVSRIFQPVKLNRKKYMETT